MPERAHCCKSFADAACHQSQSSAVSRQLPAVAACQVDRAAHGGHEKGVSFQPSVHVITDRCWQTRIAKCREIWAALDCTKERVMGLPIDRLSSRLPRRFPVGAKYVVEGYGGEEGKLRVIRATSFCLAGSGSMFQPTSLQALARYLQILSDPRGASDLWLLYSFYVWAARRASAIDAAHAVSCRRLCFRHEYGGGPPLFQNWGRSGICADCRECAAATTSRLAHRRRLAQQLRHLVKFTVNRRASSRVSPFGRRATRRSNMSGIGGEVEVRGLHLKRR